MPGSFPPLSLSASCFNWQSSLCSYFRGIPFTLRIICFHQTFTSSFFPEIHEIFFQLFLITAFKLDVSCYPCAPAPDEGVIQGSLCKLRPAASFLLHKHAIRSQVLCASFFLFHPHLVSIGYLFSKAIHSKSNFPLFCLHLKNVKIGLYTNHKPIKSGKTLF